MNNIHSRFLGAGLLGAGAFAILVGHDRLAHLLLAPLADADVPRPVGFASVSASFCVHLLTGVWLLPAARRLERLGLRADSVRIALCCALAAMFVRAIVEAASGVLVRGLPFLGIAVAVAGWTWLRDRPAVAAPLPARRAGLVHSTAELARRRAS